MKFSFFKFLLFAMLGIVETLLEIPMTTLDNRIIFIPIN